MVAEKAALRRQLKNLRLAQGQDERARLSELACAHALACIPADAGPVALYAHFSSELQTTRLFDGLRGRGQRTCFPRCCAGGSGEEKGQLIVSEGPVWLEFAEVDNTDTMVSTPFGVSEPAADAPVLPLAQIATIVVPGLAFDRAGTRLGFGAGYYDRTLADFSGLTIGLCFHFQLLEQLPRESHDCPMDLVVHDQGVLRIGAPGATAEAPQ